jgi:autotransporter adhesin
MKMQDDTVNFGRGSMDVAGNITGSRAPVKLTGVANGTSTYDAVNFGQLNDVAQRAYSGIAQVTAMANIPGPIAGKNYSIGVGTGYYRGNTALAIGGKANIGDMIQLQGSVGTGFGYTDSMSAGGGVSFSW